MKSHYRLLSFLAVACVSSIASAQDAGPPAMPPGFKQAWSDCAQQYSAPSPGQRPSSDFQSCLTAKGFPPPKGKPPGGGPGGGGPGGAGGPPSGPPPGGYSQGPDNSSGGSSSQGSAGSGSAL